MKTLKDIYQFRELAKKKQAVYIEPLKEEAIKWVKALEGTDSFCLEHKQPYSECEYSTECYILIDDKWEGREKSAVSEFIMTFFNITEEDLI